MKKTPQKFRWDSASKPEETPVPTRPMDRPPPAPSPAAAAPAAGYEAVHEPKPEAVVVHCSDPRFQVAFDEFIKGELGLERGAYIPLVIGGGIGALSHPEHLPKEFKFLKERLEFYREAFPSVRRLVLIHHEDCKYYASLKEKVLGFLKSRWQTVTGPDQEDVALVLKVFRHFLSHLGVSVELYHARFSDSSQRRITFDQMGS